MSLVYNVSSLLREPIGATRDYEVDERVLADVDQPRHERVTGHVSFLRTKDGVLAAARLRGDLSEQCSRCLKAIGVPMELEIEEEFFSTADIRTGAKLPRPQDPEAFLIGPQQLLDFEEPVRQAWTAALPMQALCRVDCLGLCPRCGKDLNLGPCDCAPEEDERWSALRRLKVEMEGR